MPGRIVVGVDGSASAAAALAWAAAEARLRGAELVVCSVVEGLRERSGSAAVTGVAELSAGYPRTVCTPHVEPGRELLASCDEADLVVVGSGGRGRLTAALLGSIWRACLSHAHCPVVVVGHPLRERPVGRVVAGVDGSGHSRAALPVAAEEARLRGATLLVLHAVHWDRIGTELITPTQEQLLGWGHTLVAAEVAATGVSGKPVVVAGHPGEVLVRHSADADLLVVATRGHNPAANLLLGSVSEHCVRHARCPVLVTRAEGRHRADDAQTSSREANR